MFGNNEIFALQYQIKKLKCSLQFCNEKELMNILAETSVKYNMDEAILANCILNNIATNIVYLGRSQYGEYVELANQYITILEDELHCLQNIHRNYTIFSQRAINLLYNNPPYFTMNKILNEDKGNRLTVSDLLSVIGYAKKIIEMTGVNVNKKYSIALTVLKTIDLALKNEKQDKPLNKLSHITNDVLTEISKIAKKDETSGKLISGFSLMIDLTIDFLIRE